jgi:hypothetical protein
LDPSILRTDAANQNPRQLQRKNHRYVEFSRLNPLAARGLRGKSDVLTPTTVVVNAQILSKQSHTQQSWPIDR